MSNIPTPSELLKNNGNPYVDDFVASLRAASENLDWPAIVNFPRDREGDINYDELDLQEKVVPLIEAKGWRVRRNSACSWWEILP